MEAPRVESVRVAGVVVKGVVHRHLRAMAGLTLVVEGYTTRNIGTATVTDI